MPIEQELIMPHKSVLGCYPSSRRGDCNGSCAEEIGFCDKRSYKDAYPDRAKVGSVQFLQRHQADKSHFSDVSKSGTWEGIERIISRCLTMVAGQDNVVSEPDI